MTKHDFGSLIEGEELPEFTKAFGPKNGHELIERLDAQERSFMVCIKCGRSSVSEMFEEPCGAK